jgi:hypothetical protein
MKLIFTDARPTLQFSRGGEPFLSPNYHTEPDRTRDIVIEGVHAFFSEHAGFLVTFIADVAAAMAYEKTGWVQDTSHEGITLFVPYDFGQRCVYIGGIAYMSWRVERG